MTKQMSKRALFKKMRTFASESDEKSPDQKAGTRAALAGKDLNNIMAHGDTLSF
jgi:hypothetical protein